MMYLTRTDVNKIQRGIKRLPYCLSVRCKSEQRSWP